MSDALPLPPRPNVDQYKKLAKDFQAACSSSEPGAVRAWAARWVEKLVRLRGLEITPQLRKEIATEAGRIEQRWHKVKKSKRVPRCTLTNAQFFIAREHGFASWAKFAKHIELLTRANSPVSHFEKAVEAIVVGDLETLRNLLRDDPGLVQARSTREHRSTLLHYVSANGVEDFRQKTPKNIVEITEMLLDAGADVNAESDAYGGGSTTLGLVATSIHPEQAGVQISLLQKLLERGARIDHQTAAGNNQSIITGCLANGQPKAAEFLASAGAPVHLEGAAGLGRLLDLKRYFEESGTPKPHVKRKQLESAFEFACWYGRGDVVEFLLGAGIDPNWCDADGQTGLHHAAYGGHVDVVKLLLQRGSSVKVKDKNYRATPLDVALWVWDNSSDENKRERCYQVVALLVRAGAKLDPQQWFNPEQNRPGMLEKLRTDTRMLAALGGETIPTAKEL
jgi:ankyrin repeat protein